MKCHSSTCLLEATHRVHWVSGPLDTCADCAHRFIRVGNALGMTVHIERLDHVRLAKALLEDDPPQ